MSNRAISFEIDADDSDLADALRDELAKALPGYQLAVRRHSPIVNTSRSIEPETVPWIAILVALPSALDSTLSLADRVKLKPRIEALIAWAAERWQEMGVRIRWGPQEGTKRPLDQAEVDEIVEALSRLASHRGGKSS